LIVFARLSPILFHCFDFSLPIAGCASYADIISFRFRHTPLRFVAIFATAAAAAAAD
jgi:hypothetical protein